MIDKLFAIMSKVKNLFHQMLKISLKLKQKKESYYGLSTVAVLIIKSIFDTIKMFSQNIYAGEIIKWQSKINANNLLNKKTNGKKDV